VKFLNIDNRSNCLTAGIGGIEIDKILVFSLDIPENSAQITGFYSPVDGKYCPVSRSMGQKNTVGDV